jgi:hypothetical protein
MARMKIEFTAALKRRHGFTLRDKLIKIGATCRATPRGAARISAARGGLALKLPEPAAWWRRLASTVAAVPEFHARLERSRKARANRGEDDPWFSSPIPSTITSSREPRGGEGGPRGVRAIA